MHLLFISSLLPEEAPSTGFEIANRAIIEALRANGVRLSFAGFTRPGAEGGGPDRIDLGTLAIENAAVGPAQKLRWVARAMASDLPVAAAKLAVLSPDALRRRLREAGPVDGYVLNSIQMPTAFPFLVTEKPSIFVAHNVEHHSAAENARNGRSAMERLLYAREARLLEKAEARLCREAVVVHTLSEDDQHQLGLGGNRKCLPLTLSIGRPPREDDGRRDHDVGLIGTWSWAPNRVGLDWFVREVAPLLPGDLRVAVAGRFDGSPPAAPANVSYVGRVPDAQAFVRASRVMALATRGGTGVQLKTIETFEEGMPAVATSSALRGADYVPGNVRVADNPRSFAEALVTLVRAEREGSVGRLDGRAFVRRQEAALQAAVGEGLARFERALSGTVPAQELPAAIVRDAQFLG
ncbi:glycosyltransferase family 4 protein [Mangrovibrevibacter kandeliae]|uniref:glycosyltransferase family 4 protein n=1 Tax=Mangrovibrevibacter kandeliae TaxID=2968473 RepID=UPI0021197FB6|nr:glycosyltransferase family 4 protein [Aurantimonas sp. CSK15Z-1]MCQ8783621.1 glycosyltransferase family 4 protein [Aurantimonas sp. CSK15Z-1]